MFRRFSVSVQQTFNGKIMRVMSLAYVALFVASTTWAGSSLGQQIPEACKPLVRASEICVRDVLRFFEVVHPDQLAIMQKRLAPELEMGNTIKQGVRNDGAEIQAERCADPKNAGSMVSSLSQLTMVMALSNYWADCREAIGDITVSQ